MYQARVYVDFESADVLDEVTRRFEAPFDVLEEEIHDDGTITFVIDTRGHQDAFLEAMADAPEVSAVEELGEGNVLVRKQAKGASVIIRENHGKLNGVDKVYGTKRVFEIRLLRRDDLTRIVEELRDFGDVRLERLVAIDERPEVLSDRQYEAVRTALELGYFEWPRDADIETVAAALGVTHPTALEHIRKAERKLIERALEEVTARPSSQDREFLLAE